ncbi:MAG: hypothetical protein ACTHL1_10110 [Burkholderiaceae bacterium]
MKKTLIHAAIAGAFATVSFAASASEAEMMQRIEQLAAELKEVKAELAATRRKTEAAMQREDVRTAQTATVAPATPDTATSRVGRAAEVAEAIPAGAGEPKTVVTGYGEVNYNRPTKNASAAQADVRRAVIGIEHRFDERTKLVSEFEWEHAVTSADDAGETAVEQLYVEREFGIGLRAKAGLFLIPSGLLNTNHEPTAFYGVERNFVETAIIPSTWREAGVGLSGAFENGLTWDAGVTTGFDLSKWDAASAEGRESPLGSIHQEGQLAKSRNLSVYGALNWRGVPGLLLGGSVFTGKAGQGTADFPAQDARITLWDLHGRYTPGRWDLSALYARGQISNIDALNLTFAGSSTLVPKVFDGWYTQAAYQLWKSGNYTLSPFLRYEQFNTAKSYTALPVGLGVAPGAAEKVWTVGANLLIGEGVVLKADYQKFREDSTRDRVDLGVGFSF